MEILDMEELLERLVLDGPEDFKYFENLADLIELCDEIPYELMYQLIRNVDFNVLAELINDYFEDILSGVPDNASEFYSLLQTIGMSLSGMAAGMSEEDDIVVFCDELDRFRKWYINDGIVYVRESGKDSGAFRELSPIEAISLARSERIIPEISYEYDFKSALDYEIKDYVMSFRDMIASEDDGSENSLNSDGLMDGYVYDDEFKDEY